MPFRSRSQQRFFFSAEARGALPKETAKTWAAHTPDIKSLPDKVKPGKESQQRQETKQEKAATALQRLVELTAEPVSALPPDTGRQILEKLAMSLPNLPITLTSVLD